MQTKDVITTPTLSLWDFARLWLSIIQPKEYETTHEKFKIRTYTWHTACHPHCHITDWLFHTFHGKNMELIIYSCRWRHHNMPKSIPTCKQAAIGFSNPHINIRRAKCIIFSSNKRLYNSKSINLDTITLGDNSIDRVGSVQFLGLIFKETLTCKLYSE